MCPRGNSTLHLQIIPQMIYTQSRCAQGEFKAASTPQDRTAHQEEQSRQGPSHPGQYSSPEIWEAQLSDLCCRQQTLIF